MTIKKGKLLIAEPSIIGDISFNRSIILLADHNNEGSIGFILNKPLDYCLGDLIPEIESNLPIYNGGPVQQDNLYFIHKVAELIPESIEISEGLFWSGNFEHVSKLVAEEKIKQVKLLFEATGATQTIQESIKEHTERAFRQLDQADLSAQAKTYLSDFGKALMNRNF